MLLLFPLLFLTATINAYPTEDTQTIETTTDIVIINLQKDINVISYIQNFKTVMANYVNSQYRNLTINEMEQVKIILEEFLKGFADDLRDTIQGNNNDDLEDSIDDGLPNETFQDIKEKIVQEFPEVDEEVAEKIVKKLRKNLFTTRHRLDEIIRQSQKAQIENS